MTPLRHLDRQTAKLLILIIRVYQLTLSPWLGRSCRFSPTCSQYGIDALEDHGTLAGCWLTVRRLSRCHPWCEGGHDPVPQPHAYRQPNRDPNHGHP
ncbi:MAG: membrane protein insertion efficiency factor YidD [Luminiphilus sp.]|nr:membrane protein insertion efficiency factor YidD [Luminiphilus sp.]